MASSNAGDDRISAARWEHFEHGADIGVRGFGPTCEAAFEAAAMAMTAVIGDPDNIAQEWSIEVECEAADRELLLADWLNAIIYEMATRHALFSGFAVTLSGNRLTGRISGETVDVARHHPAVEIKGATYTALQVTETDGGWLAQLVVDV